MSRKMMCDGLKRFTALLLVVGAIDTG